MNLEQLAIMGIAVFAFMALAAGFNVMRSIKRMTKPRGAFRVRRLVGGQDSSRQIARNVVEEVARANPEAVEASREDGRVTPELEKAFEDARTYFLGRVEPRHKFLFNDAVDEIVLKKGRLI